MLILLLSCSHKKPVTLLVSSLSETETGINFKNGLNQSYHDLTVVDYLYYYNGGGVAAGDINNDGLDDLFFVSNHGPNKLFLNLGNMRFRDISDSAGITGFSQWDTGVAMADVNNDGLLDIYVSAISNYKGIEGANELFINNGDHTFTERAADFGLDYAGFVTQTVFFDYDHDGDLDCYMATHASHNARSYDRVMGASLTNDLAVDRFYKNVDGFFILANSEVGIDTSARAFNLSMAVADFNNDNWEDIYTGSDFYEDDQYYLNTQRGSFREEANEHFEYFSRYTKGIDAADLDNDGWEDLMTLDIRPSEREELQQNKVEDVWKEFLYKKTYGYKPQFTRNTLQKNIAGNFVEIGGFAGVHSIGWGSSVLFLDLDDDGLKDIFTSSGTPADLIDRNYLEYAHIDSMRYALQLSNHHVRKALQLLKPSAPRHNVFLNHGQMQFDQVDLGTGEKEYSSGAAYSDLDLDGDLDIVLNNINSFASVYRNESGKNFLNVRLSGKRNRFGVGAKIKIVIGGNIQMQHVMPIRGLMSSSTLTTHFGIGDVGLIDSVVVTWGTGHEQILTDVKANQIITVYENDELPDLKRKGIVENGKPSNIIFPWKHVENEYYDFYREPSIPFLLSREGPALAVGDVNGDGLDDVFAGGAKHAAAVLMLQKPNGYFKIKNQDVFEQDKLYEDVSAAFFDLDGDKDLDLYVVAGGGEFTNGRAELADRIYLNDGDGNFTRGIVASLLCNKSCVRPCDFDNDGDMDLFVGGRMDPYHYGNHPPSVLFENNNGSLIDVTAKHDSTLRNPGMVTDAQWGDVDGDGDADLLVAGDWMPIRLYLNEKGKLVENKNYIQGDNQRLFGFWQCLLPVDYDQDGDLDVLAGNLGLNHVFPKNRELRLYTLEQKGQQHTIFCIQSTDERFYPFAAIDDLKEEFGADLLKDVNQYAKSDIQSLASYLDAKIVSYIAIDQLASMALTNLGNSSFRADPLPNEVQWSKIFCMNKNSDSPHQPPLIVVFGNTKGVSPLQGVYTGNVGLTLQWQNGKLSFTGFITPTAPREARAVHSIKVSGQHGFIVAFNNDSLQLLNTIKMQHP